MRNLLAALAVLMALPSAAAAQEAYCVDDATDVVGSYRADLKSLPCPVGTTGVTKADIEAVYSGPLYQGGTWTAGAYTLPASKQPPTTPVGFMREACRETDRALFELAREIRERWSIAFPPAVINPAAGTVLQVRKGVRGVALQTNNADWTQARRLTFVQRSGDGGMAADILAPFARAWGAGNPLSLSPGLRLVWVDPATGAAVTDIAVILAGADEADMAPDAAEQSSWRRPGAWCREIAG